MIKAILLDYTGTVLQQAGADIEKMLHLVTKNSDFSSPKEAMAFWFSNLERLEKQSCGKTFLSQDEICLQLLQLCAETHKLQGDREALHRLNQGLWSNGPFFPDTVAFFDACPLPIYIITNNGSEYVAENFRKNNLTPAGIISAEEVKAYKPRAEIFAAALQKAGCTADEAVHIGDSYTADYLGAQAVGLRCILLDRAGTDTHACEKAATLPAALAMV